MSSILTNNSAMVALQTLRTINTNMSKTQNEISTGKSVSNARDNSAIWSISKTMESDVKGFKGIADSLALGSSTIAVARSASEQITDLLTEIKGKIVAAQEDNVDRDKIQTDLSALRSQISSITGAAQFNGLNLLSNRESGATVANIVANTGTGAGVLGSGSVNILSSLDRSSSGSVTASTISASKADLGMQASTAGVGTDIAASAFTGAGAITAGNTGTLTVAGDTTTTARAGNKVLAGDTYTIGGLTGISNAVRYVARDGDTVQDIAANLTNRLNFEAESAGVKISAALGSNGAITITNNTAASITTTAGATTAGTSGGGLEILKDIDVSTENGAKAALSAIEGLTQTAVGAAADFGSVQGRIDVQSKYVNSLMDSLKSGIGSLVDADMEETSARLQALQVQQQLGVQALSIANQAPQNILSLFR
ncbi:MAG: flagellin [Rhodobacter sp.]|uniref:flagellin n=1 Tax=Pararhodobacter sp. TaxID=2127056 RepID=UPI001DF14CEE|nr:flagellin [Pararhodobacter sp.]MCB1344058.1 flagellin [Paracoccaceae bacterium]MCC0072523.1 flagellin [Rhodobacter sp.]HPD93449.1 flagellin [Pararhodobacter sp.]